MSMVFLFSDKDDLKSLTKYEVYRTYFPLPEEITLLPDAWELVLKIAYAVGKLTQASLHITCREVGLKDHFIKAASLDPKRISIGRDFYSIPIVFQYLSFRTLTQPLKIFNPTTVFFEHFRWSPGKRKSLRHNVMRTVTPRTPEQVEAYQAIQEIVEHALILLNQQPHREPQFRWDYIGFNGRWRDDEILAIWKRHDKQRKQEERERKKREEKAAKEAARLEKKRQASLARGQALPKEEGQSGKKRAIPGVFRGINMRSQLEIRFAAELESRAIPWQYEPERLSESNYLVDFYLPDQKMWVEVKGKFEPRDELVLPEVAKYLELRSESLYVYTQKDVFLVHVGGFRSMIKDDFWGLMKKR